MVVLLRPPGRRGNHNHKLWGLSSGDCTRLFSEAPDCEMRMAKVFGSGCLEVWAFGRCHSCTHALQSYIHRQT